MKEQVQVMIDWIEKRLKEPFSLDELAAYMGYSPYYCSFTFHRLTGMSMRRYVLLRRLYLSTYELSLNRKIIDVAFAYNYSSQEAYSRAFKKIFGLTPKEYQRQRVPVQSTVKLTFHQNRADNYMDVSKKLEVTKVQEDYKELFDQEVLHILNGQMMYEEFKEQKLMGASIYAPFNEAMCVNETSEHPFGETFIHLRANGHGENAEKYTDKVIAPLEPFFSAKHQCIVLWFGEDLFCQMNLLTLLAYLEQTNFEGKVFLHSFREDEFKVNQVELTLGHYDTTYQEVLVQHQEPTHTLIPVMYQAVHLYLDMLKEENQVVRYIKQNQNLTSKELVKQLLSLFPAIGYGDTQYLQLIEKVRS